MFLERCDWKGCKRLADMSYAGHLLCDWCYANRETSELHARWPEAAGNGCLCETCKT